MKTIMMICAGLFMSLTISAQQLPIDYSGVKVTFNYVDKDVDGSLSGLEGTIKFDPNDLAGSSISGSVDVNTLSTGIGLRNWHLKTGAYFNADDYPKMTYQSTGFQKTDDGYLMNGKLTIKDKTLDVPFNFTYSNKVFTGTAEIYALDYDVSPTKKREDSKVTIKVVIPVK